MPRPISVYVQYRVNTTKAPSLSPAAWAARYCAALGRVLVGQHRPPQPSSVSRAVNRGIAERSAFLPSSFLPSSFFTFFFTVFLSCISSIWVLRCISKQISNTKAPTCTPGGCRHHLLMSRCTSHTLRAIIKPAYSIPCSFSSQIREKLTTTASSSIHCKHTACRIGNYPCSETRAPISCIRPPHHSLTLFLKNCVPEATRCSTCSSTNAAKMVIRRGFT